MSQPESEQINRMSDPDPFDLARRLRERLQVACASRPQAECKFLWLCVSKAGVGVRADNGEALEQPTLEQWLNVVDEAAALGVESLVLSTQSDLSNDADIWEIARWAQDTHHMIVGIHLYNNCVSESLVANAGSLDLARFRLFVSKDCYDDASKLESHGIRVRIAKPATDAPDSPCNMPKQMIYVNPYGEMYTCGMVEGKQKFCMGHVLKGFFDKVLTDPDLPHSIPAQSQGTERGCEGCPPLLSMHFYDD